MIFAGTSLSKLLGIIFVYEIYPLILSAINSATASFIYSVIACKLCLCNDLKIPGKTKELLIWF